jgi:hypothetical protein
MVPLFLGDIVKKFIIVLLIILLTSCTYRKNGANIWELDGGSDSSMLNNYRVSPRKTPKNGRYAHYHYGSGWSYWENENEWRPRQLNRYDYLYNKALENNVNPHWYIDKNFGEGEDDSHS